MSGHCQSCGTYHEEDDERLCASCRYGGVTPSKDDACEIARLRAEVERLNGQVIWWKSSLEEVASIIGIKVDMSDNTAGTPIVVGVLALAERERKFRSILDLIAHRCANPAKPGQILHHDPAEIARDALGGGS